MALDAAQIVQQYTSDYRAGIITLPDLIAPLYDRTEWDEMFMMVETDNTVIDRVSWKTTGARFQKFQKAFLPLGGMKFVPNVIPLYNIMGDTDISPDELVASALDFLKQQGVKREGAPILGIYQKAWLTEAMDNFHRNETYKAVDAPIVAGTSTAEGALFQGIKEQIRLAKLNPAVIYKPTTLTLGAVPTDPVLFVEYVETYFDSLPDQIKILTKHIACSQTLLIRYKTGLRLKYKTHGYDELKVGLSFNGEKSAPLVDRDCMLHGTFNMIGSNKLWSTVQGNAVKGMKNSNNITAWNQGVSIGGRTVWMSKDFWIGYGFLNWEWVYETDQS